MKTLIYLIFSCFFINITKAVIGVDVSAPTSGGTFQCMADNGIQFAIVRGYQSFGAVDPNAVSTLQGAQSAGLITDIYVFPCMGVNPSDIASDVMNNIPSNLFGTVWMDVEINPSYQCGWSSDINQNCQYLSNLVGAFQQYGALVGIYSSQYEWTQIFGDPGNCPYFTNLQVWYADYDDDASFEDWPYVSFGNWANPNIKQYDGDNTICGQDVDMDYYPG